MVRCKILKRIPVDLKELNKTVWEMSMKDIIDMSRQRGYFIDQSQSLNLFYARCYVCKINLDAFLRLEIRFKNWNVLFKNKAAVDKLSLL